MTYCQALSKSAAYSLYLKSIVINYIEVIVNDDRPRDMGRKQHRCHGSAERFDVLATFIETYYGNSIQYIADVAGGQGILSRLLSKKYNYDCEVIDPRGHTLKGVSNRAAEFQPEMAGYYDLIVGLHPDEATRPIAEAALIRPTLIIPCCNFWSNEKLGRDELVDAIATYYQQHDLIFEIVKFDFKGPKNIGIVSQPR